MNGFEIIDKLGDGAYSEVFKVKRKQDNNIYALKKVKLKGLSDKEKQNALNEVRILASVKSNFVISYKEAFIDEEDSSLCLVMEYADKGDLYQKITQFKKIGCLIEEIDVWRIFIQMVKGLKALHDLKILHRDLKSANIFLFSDGSAKIGDLNVSKVVYKGLGYTQTGTPYYASPEVWKDQPYDNKSDIWSLGCVTFEMLALRPPFRAENMEKLYNKVIKGQYGKISERYSDDIKEIIKFMLKPNPSDRPSCAQILNHDLVKKRLEFFKAQAGFDEEHYSDIDERVLLKTIRIPKNILFLTERLPEANYGNENSKGEMNCNKNKNKTFQNNSLPDIKFQFNKNKTNNNKFISNIKTLNKNKDIFGIEKGKCFYKNLNIKNKNEKLNDINNNKLNDNDINETNEYLNDAGGGKKMKINIDLRIKNNKKNKIHSNKNILQNEDEKRQIFQKLQKEEIIKINQNIKKLFKNDNSDYFQDLKQTKKIGINSSERKEFDPLILNHKKFYRKQPKIKKDDFQNYLKSIGLGDMYKLCMPNTVENNSKQNSNNRYKSENRHLNYLPNIYSINQNKNGKGDIFIENKVIPNRRLAPLEKK